MLMLLLLLDDIVEDVNVDDVGIVDTDEADVDNRERGLGTLPGVSLIVAFATAYELRAR